MAKALDEKGGEKNPQPNPKANIKQQDPRESRKNEINNRGNWLAPPTKCCLTEKLNSVGLNKALNWLGQKKKKKTKQTSNQVLLDISQMVLLTLNAQLDWKSSLLKQS